MSSASSAPLRIRASLGSYTHGLATAIALAALAAFLSSRYGGPQHLYALLFGIAGNFLRESERFRPGIELGSRGVLRLGVALLGLRITLAQVAELGWTSVLGLVVAISCTIVFTALLARRMRRPAAEGVLAGGAVAICGASAALALAAVLPRSERSTRFTLLTVVGVTALSTLAMILYPALASALHLGERDAGIFLGGTIHDVAQVVGAGYMISPLAGDTATLVKLLRVALLVPVVLACSLVYRGQGAATKAPLLPWFLLLFAGFVLLRSTGLVPPTLVSIGGELSRACLLTAIAALGLKTSFQELLTLGWQPIALLLGATLFLATFVLFLLTLP
jgi:uncharacterized integral membrane protein (TIGR00698 family)